MIAEPPETAGDMHFSLRGIPIRIHPMFWGVTLLLGAVMPGATPTTVALWISAVLVSILVHELGHALAARAFGWPPRIVLHGMGGLALYRPTNRRWHSRALIAAAGPGAGFVLGGVVLMAAVLSGHAVTLDPLPIRIGTGTLLDGRLGLFVVFMMYVNFFWGFLNLLPIHPLDGGAISESLLQRLRPRDGVELSYKISTGVAVVLAILALVLWQSLFLTVMFAALAWNAWSLLQAYR
jgi:stage IV sporulation protein FB